MAITLLTSGGNTNAGRQSLVTDSVTTVTGRLYIAQLWTPWASPIPTLDGASQTWDKIGETPYNVVGVRGTAFRCLPTSGASGALTFTTGTNFSNAFWLVAEVTDPVPGSNGASAIIQAVIGESSGATQTINYPNPWAADSHGLAVFCTNTGALTSSPRSGWTEADERVLSGDSGFAVQVCITSDTAAANTWSGSAESAGIALELGRSVTPPPSVPVIMHHLRNQGIS